MEKIKNYLDNSVVPKNKDTKYNEYYLPNRAGFIKNVDKIFKYEISKEIINSSKIKLLSQQKTIRNFLQLETPYRGLLLFHSLGSGKTITTIALTELLIKNKDIVVILPTYLETNFYNELKFYGGKYYTVEQFWEFIPITSTDLIDELSTKNKIDMKVIKKNKGVWITNKYKKSNYNKLDDEQKNQINNQINSIIQSRYHFIHYDGLNKKVIEKYKSFDGNFFENKVVIIDEVHNFISKVINQGLAKELYSLILKTTNSKIICLSGTPLVNYPYELAFIINLVKGINKRYILNINDKIIDDTVLKNFIKTQNYIDDYKYDVFKRKLMIKLLPHGFIKIKNDKVIYNPEISSSRDDNKIINNFCEEAYKLNINISNIFSCENNYYLPFNNEDFNNYFIDEKKLQIKNIDLFQRTILGSVSYYNSKDLSLFPVENKMIIEELHFSDLQFKKYVKERINERKTEKPSNNLFEKKPSMFKVRTRAICNFVFPEAINRPYPSDIRYMLKELDEEELENLDEDTLKKTLAIKTDNEYDKLKKSALEELDKSDYLDDNNLQDYSPKFSKLLENINKSAGPILLYSDFRNVEGLRIFKMVLDKRNYTEFKIIKDSKKNWRLNMAEKDINKSKYIIFDSNKEKNEILRDIFNSDFERLNKLLVKDLKNIGASKDNLHGDIIKIIMITKTGSEGISLKNVRQVHILEPYWNYVRIKQVIGRAIRAKSHLALPENERVVDTFLYLMTFTKKQLEEGFKFKKDNNLTTDQNIYSLAEKKKVILTKIEDLLRKTSIDCSNTDCFKSVKNNSNIILKNTIIEEELNSNTAVNKLVKIKIDNNLDYNYYFYDKNTENLYNYNLFNNTGKYEIVGYLKDINEDHYELTIINKIN